MNANDTSVRLLRVVFRIRSGFEHALRTVCLGTKLTKFQLFNARNLRGARIAHKGHTCALDHLHHFSLFVIRRHMGFLLECENRVLRIKKTSNLAIFTQLYICDLLIEFYLLSFSLFRHLRALELNLIEGFVLFFQDLASVSNYLVSIVVIGPRALRIPT